MAFLYTFFFEQIKADRISVMNICRDTNNWYCDLSLFFRSNYQSSYQHSARVSGIGVFIGPVQSD